MNTVSNIGSKLDTFADFVMLLTCSLKIFPSLVLPKWLVVWIVLIATTRCLNLILGYLLGEGLIIRHTVLNKVTGFLLFLFPLTLEMIAISFSGAIVCIAAMLVAIEESRLIISYLKS